MRAEKLIGLAFDGNIESLSSDLRFNPTLQRCINADIRYILFVIDTYGGSKYLIDEMEIRNDSTSLPTTDVRPPRRQRGGRALHSII